MPSDSSYSVGTVNCPKIFSRPDIVLDINTAEEYQMINKLYESLVHKKPNFTFSDVIEWFDLQQYNGE